MIIIIENIKEYKKFIIVIVVSVLLNIIFLLNPKKITKKEIIYKEAKITKEENKNEKIFVEIKGAVLTPGVYEMDINNRVIDLINKSGGLTDNANVNYLNLSSKLKDEMVVKIYTNEELNNKKKVEIIYEYIPMDCECPIKECEIKEEDDININKISKEETKININKASKEELMTLSGFGETKALNVIQYRSKNGDFKKIEDIMNVSGIGENVFNKIKEYIEV